jgi:hypothetical protein
VTSILRSGKSHRLDFENWMIFLAYRSHSKFGQVARFSFFTQELGREALCNPLWRHRGVSSQVVSDKKAVRNLISKRLALRCQHNFVL